MRTTLLLAVAAFMTVSSGSAVGTSMDAGLLPTLDVQFYPFAGTIPAIMANGRPVYRFQVAVFDEEKKIVLVSENTLLQNGMTRTTQRSGREGDIRARVSLADDGVAKYRVVYSREGRAVLASTGHLRLTPGNLPRRDVR